ncbi:TRAP transporter substrate-binding protein DctP [Croceibacterium mercuriale]|nr:TRAP transporter substrate-binding protein DctP [Croceibacterium mercuriale]
MMPLRTWLALLLAPLLALAGCAKPLPAGVTELTYASPYPPSHPFSRADRVWMDHVAQQSNGRLRIRPVWSGALMSADMSMEELRHGVADIALISPIYSRGGTHLLRTQTGFYKGAQSIESQMALYHCLARSEPEIGRELHGLKVLAAQGGLLPGIMIRGRAVRSLDDLRGLRIRAPTELLSVLGSFGADPVLMPMGEVYSQLAKGVLDGVVSSPDSYKALHLSEVTDYYFALEIPRGAYPARAMGDDRWHRLEPWQRDILAASTPVWERAIADAIYTSLEAGLEDSRGKVQVFQPSAADQQRFEDVYQRDNLRTARDARRWGIDGEAVFRRAQASLPGDDRVVCGGAA